MKKYTLMSLMISLAAVALTGCYLYVEEDDRYKGHPEPWPPGEECWSDYDCGPSGYCEYAANCTEYDCYPAEWGFCVYDTYCFDDYDCPLGSVCDEWASVCVPVPDECETDEECGPGCYCDDGTCAPNCSFDSDCSDGEFCNANGQCEEDIVACPAIACAPGSTMNDTTCECVPDSCDSNTDCADGSYCDPNADADRGECVPGPACSIDDDCSDGEACNGYTCEAIDCENYRTDEAACIAADPYCFPTYYGTGCEDPNGLPCTSGQSNCVCENFFFGGCATAP